MADEAPGKRQPPAFDLHNCRSVLFVSVILFVLVLWVFLPAIQDPFHIFDDFVYILGNSHVNSGLSRANILWAFHGFAAANWHPVTWLSHMLDVQIYGLNPWGHHLTSILLHGLNTVLVFLVFRKMTGAGWRCLVVAALFGLHPLRVEPVVWISDRKDVLCTTFWLSAMWAYARFADELNMPAGRPKLFYGLTALFFALGLMSKQMVVTLPFVFLLLDFWPLNRWRHNPRLLVLEKIPFFALTAAASVVAYITKQEFGSLREMAHLDFPARVENAFVSYVRYLGEFFWPENLCVYNPHPEHWHMMVVLPAALFVGVVSTLAWMKREKVPWLFVGWFWYLGTLVPVIGLVPLYSLAIADCWTYIPLIGVNLILVWGLGEAAARWRKELHFVVAAAIIACIAVTRHQIDFWKDNVTLWNRATAVTKNNYVAHKNLGIILSSAQPDAALAEFKKAVEINPGSADAQRYLAYDCYIRGLLDDAIAHYQKSLDIDPVSGVAEFTLGLAYYQKGRLDDAVVHFQKSVEIDPNNSGRRNNLGAALLAKGDVDGAISQFQIVLKLEPDSRVTRSNLNLALKMKDRATETNLPSK